MRHELGSITPQIVRAFVRFPYYALVRISVVGPAGGFACCPVSLATVRFWYGTTIINRHKSEKLSAGAQLETLSDFCTRLDLPANYPMTILPLKLTRIRHVGHSTPR